MMIDAQVKRIADAVLYEGYILYPYRPSVKNRQRWTFGGLYPPAYCSAQQTNDSPSLEAECLIRGSQATVFHLTVRFLHLINRTVGQFAKPLPRWVEQPLDFHEVETLRIGDRKYHAWQEAEECDVEITGLQMSRLLREPISRSIRFLPRRWMEPLESDHGIAGVLVREQHSIDAIVDIRVAELVGGVFKAMIRVENQTPFPNANSACRDDALLRSLVSCHAVLGIKTGEFISLLDPPEDCRTLVAGCRNRGVWPVLVGEAGRRDTMLASPIILYDYPQVAPQSPGDLFDGTEIDEILTLRILTMTDEEKATAAAVDGRIRDLLARTGSLGREELYAMHGTIRDLQPSAGE